tara:strand:- start:184 stop:528 length:345 start_codon:yes stop_codon:yes gene_type:complete
MQQVHEGAYDFNRYSVLGHRYLFKHFKLIDLGGNQGSDVVFAWSSRYLVWSILRSRKLARVIGLLIGFFLRPLRILIDKRSLYDSSSGVFFLGVKVKNFVLKHKELIKLYKGLY